MTDKEELADLPPRESYEGTGGWNDGRLGQAHDLIDAYLTEIGVTSGRHKLLTMIEQLDEERGA